MRRDIADKIKEQYGLTIDPLFINERKPHQSKMEIIDGALSLPKED